MLGKIGINSSTIEKSSSYLCVVVETADHVLRVIFLADQRVERVGQVGVVLGLETEGLWGSQLGITDTDTLLPLTTPLYNHRVEGLIIINIHFIDTLDIQL